MRKAAVQGWPKDDLLFAGIGAFLHAHGLSPDPAHYAFAYAALTDSAMASAVARLTDGGIRLGRKDIEELGGMIAPPAGSAVPAEDRHTAELMAQTRAQFDEFVDLMRTFQSETSGFGRDLEQSAAAIQRQPNLAGIGEIARITGAMTARIRDAEVRLATVTTEADMLRVSLAEAQDTARRDVLTGLSNRLAFEEAFARLDRTAGPVCLAVCDVDHFKRLNDEHGHGVGDRVLSAIGQGLESGCAGHFVARHGGEEFAVLMEGMTLSAAAELLDTARAGLSARRFRDRVSGAALGRITLSAGVVALRPDEAFEAAFARADRLLYAAKADGRDRVCAG